jgi:hypothetical protein
MIRKCFSLALAFGFLIPAGQVAAHTPLFACFDNADGTIFCEGGFSDGSSAAGVPILVKDGSGAELFRGELSKNSDIVFDKPAGDYLVIFDGGDEHRIEIPGAQIFK